MNRVRAWVTALAALAVAVGTGLPASAQATDADSVAGVIDRAAPDVTVEPVQEAVNGRLASSGSVAVSAPATAAGAVQIGGLVMDLPGSATAAADVATDGTVVYDGGSTDLAVQALSDGARVQAVIPGANAPQRFAYTFSGGVVPVVESDGSATLTIPSGDGIVAVLGTVDAPWATDANGNAVPTRYVVDGNSLVQVVDHQAAGVAYPVVADPRVTVGWGIYVHYTAAEARANSSGWRGTLNDKAKYTAILCGLIGANVAAGACAVLTYDVISSVMSTMKRAGATGHRFYYHCWFNGMPLGWGYE